MVTAEMRGFLEGGGESARRGLQSLVKVGPLVLELGNGLGPNLGGPNLLKNLISNNIIYNTIHPKNSQITYPTPTALLSCEPLNSYHCDLPLFLIFLNYFHNYLILVFDLLHFKLYIIIIQSYKHENHHMISLDNNKILKTSFFNKPFFLLFV